jgi:hypothetical protein
MTTIRIPADLGRRLPGRAPVVTPPALNQTAQAVSDLGRTALGFATDMRAQQTRQEAQEREQAERIKAYAATNEGEVELKRLAEDIGERVLSGAASEKDADQEWQSRAKDLRAERIKDMPPHLQEQVGGMLVGAAARAEDSVLRRAKRERVRAEIKAGLLTSMEAAERNALTDRPRALEHMATMLEQVGSGAGLGPDDQVRVMQGFRERTANNEVRTLLRAAGNTVTRLDELMGRVQGDAFPDLTPEARGALEGQIANRKAQLLHAREVEQRRAEAAAERRLREAEHATKALQGVIDGGALPDQAFLEDVQKRTVGTPYATTIATMVRQGADRAGFASLPPDQQRDQLLALRAAANVQGTNPAVEQRLRQFEEIHARQSKLAVDEPLRWGLGTRLLPDLPALSFTSLEELPALIGARVDAAKTVSASLGGRPVSPLLSAEAQQLGRTLTGLSPEHRGNAIAMLSAAVPTQQMQAIARQIDERDKPLALAMAAGADRSPQGRTVAELILRGAQAVKEKGIKEDTAAEFGLRARIANYIGEAVPEAVRADVIDAARLISLGKAAQGDRVSDREAVRIAIVGDIVEHNGRRVPVPTGLDLPRRLESLPESAIASQAPDGMVYLPDGRPMRVADFLGVLPRAQLEPAGLGKYYVRSGDALIVNRGRVPVVVDVLRILNP